MNFKSRELSFNLKDKRQFSAEAVQKALKAEGFAEAQLKDGPPSP
jgi:hypothetical protein